MPYYVACKTCYGTGKIDCENCNRTGEIKVGFLKRIKKCDKCDGTGFIICDDCNGEGRKTRYII
jgi:DnaJ-class molecular chaperone